MATLLPLEHAASNLADTIRAYASAVEHSRLSGLGMEKYHAAEVKKAYSKVSAAHWEWEQAMDKKMAKGGAK